MSQSTGWSFLLISLLNGAAAAATPIKLPSAIADRMFVCTGTHSVQGTGIKPTQTPATLTIKFGRDTASVSTTTSGYTELFCTEEQECRVNISGTAIDLSFRAMMIGHGLTLDWKTGIVDYGTGGLDGGQNFHGHCQPDNAGDR